MTDLDRLRKEWQTAHFEFWNHERMLHGRDATGFIKAEHYIAALEQRVQELEADYANAAAGRRELAERAEQAEADLKQLRSDSRSYWKLVAEQAEARDE